MPTLKFNLLRNPKAARSGAGLLRLTPDGKFDWVRPIQMDSVSATYDLEPGFYVLVRDSSSHRNDRKSWTIVQVIPEGAAVVREEAKVWRENREWGCSWWGKEGDYALIARIAAEYKNRPARDMSTIEILNAFLECAIRKLGAEAEQERRRNEPPPGG